MSKERPFEDITPVPNIKVGYFEKEEYLKIIDRQKKQIETFAYQIMALQSRIEILEKSKRPQGDLISREALREDLRGFFPSEVLEGMEPKTLFAQIMHDIDNAPTVLHDNYSMGYQDGIKKALSERLQGKWIFHKDYNENCRYGCNQCGNLTNIPNNFCPNCGANMQKGSAKE